LMYVVQKKKRKGKGKKVVALVNYYRLRI
jgi:hypothetical protein